MASNVWKQGSQIKVRHALFGGVHEIRSAIHCHGGGCFCDDTRSFVRTMRQARKRNAKNSAPPLPPASPLASATDPGTAILKAVRVPATGESKPASYPTSSARNSVQPQRYYPKFEWLLGYSYLQATPEQLSNRIAYLHGGSTSFAYNLNRWFSLVADIGGFDDSKLQFVSPDCAVTVNIQGHRVQLVFNLPRLLAPPIRKIHAVRTSSIRRRLCDLGDHFRLHGAFKLCATRQRKRIRRNGRRRSGRQTHPSHRLAAGGMVIFSSPISRIRGWRSVGLAGHHRFSTESYSDSGGERISARTRTS